MKETNMEHYRKKIEEILKTTNCFALQNNELKRCNEVCCSDCCFRAYGKGCAYTRIKWLMAEYEPKKPKLTKRERALCEFLEDSWIARDRDNCLFWYSEKPMKKATDEWGFQSIDSDVKPLNIAARLIPYMKVENLFQFITWEDDEPWSVEELLKLEVIE